MRSRRLRALLSLAVLLAVALGVIVLLGRDRVPAPVASGDAARGTEEDDAEAARLEGRNAEDRGGVREAPPEKGAREGDDLVLQGRGRVTGRIVGPKGRPVAGATAGYEVRWDGRLDAALADDEGRFEFVRPPGDAFVVVAVAPGHGIARGPRVLLRVGDTVDVGTLRLAKGYAIGGRIVDPGGEPAEGVGIAIMTEADPVPETWARASSAFEMWHGQATDEAGRFVFEHLPEGVYRVMVSYGVSESWDEVRQHVPAGTHDLRFVAPAGAELVDGRVRVRAVGPDGETIPCFRGRIDAANGASSSSWASGGELHIGSEEMVAPVRLLVWDAADEAHKPLGYGVGVVRAVTAREKPYVVRLERAGHVAGRVLWDGEPRGWLVDVRGRVDEDGTLASRSHPGFDDLPTIQQSTKSDPSGAFRFVGLPPGEVVIGLRSGGGSYRLAEGDVVAEVGRDDVVLRLVATGTIRVRLHAPEGKSMRWGAGRLMMHAGGSLVPAGSSTAGSSNDQAYFDFTFGELDLEGRYRLETSVVAAGRSYTGEVLDGITPREERYEVHVGEGLSIVGRVLRRDGTPVPGVDVHYRPHTVGQFEPWTWRLGEKHYREVTTGKDGTFVLSGLDPVDVVLTVVTPGLSLTAPPPRVSPGARGLRLEVAPAWRISGRVEDDVGTRVDDLRVAAVCASGDVRLWRPHEVAADGFFEVRGLHKGRWRIVGWCAEEEGDPRFVLSEPLSAGTKDVRLVVRRGCALRGVARTADGAAIQGATVRLVGPWTNRRERTGKDGGYAFAGVPPGAYVLEACVPLGGDVRRPFTVVAGAEALEVDVVIP